MRPVRKAENHTTSLCRCHESGNLNFLEPSWLFQTCNGTATVHFTENIFVHVQNVIVLEQVRFMRSHLGPETSFLKLIPFMWGICVRYK